MSRVKLALLSIAFPVGGIWKATQSLAEKVEYDVLFLGDPLFHLGSTPVYAPWKIFSWSSMYHAYIPNLIRSSFLWIPAGLLVMVGLLCLFRPKKVLTNYGSARWAEYRDLLKMDLISGSGVVVGLNDPPWKRSITAFLRRMELRKKEKEGECEVRYDRQRDKKMDAVSARLDKIRSQIEDVPKGSPAYEKLVSLASKDEKRLSDLSRSYDAKKDNKFSVYYPYVWPYKKLFSLYTHLSHKYLRDNSNKHMAVIAPTRSGKGVGLIVPTLLGGWKASCVVNDIKSENWAITAGYRKYRMGQKVIKFEPTAADGSSARWNPLDEIRIGDPMEVQQAQNLAAVLADYEGKGKPDHWTANASNVIMAVILHLKYAHYADPAHYPTPPNLYTVASFLKAAAAPKVKTDEDAPDENGDPVAYIDYDDVSVEDFVTAIQTLTEFPHIPKEGIEIDEWDTKKNQYAKRRFTPQDLMNMYPAANLKLHEDGSITHPIVGQAFVEISKKPDNELGSIVSTANTALKEYLDPVLTMNTSVSDFCIDDVMNYDRAVSVYLVTPPSDLLRLAPIFRLFFEMMVRHHAREMSFVKARPVDKYKHKCLFLMDEFSSLGNLQSFASTLSYIAGYGMKAFLIIQGLPQMNSIYGKDNQIIMNCHLQIYYAPNDNDTAKYAEEMLGKKTLVQESESSSGGLFAKKNISKSQIGRSLMTADELKRLGDQEIIIASGSPPVLTDKIKYYENEYFTQRLIEAPVVSDVIRTDKEHNYNPKREELLLCHRMKERSEKRKNRQDRLNKQNPRFNYITLDESKKKDFQQKKEAALQKQADGSSKPASGQH